MIKTEKYEPARALLILLTKPTFLALHAKKKTLAHQTRAAHITEEDRERECDAEENEYSRVVTLFLLRRNIRATRHTHSAPFFPFFCNVKKKALLLVDN